MYNLILFVLKYSCHFLALIWMQICFNLASSQTAFYHKLCNLDNGARCTETWVLLTLIYCINLSSYHMRGKITEWQRKFFILITRALVLLVMKRAWLFRQFCHSLNIYSWLFIPNCTRNHVITYTNCGIALVQKEKRKFSTKGVDKSQITTVEWCQSWCSERYPGMCTYVCVCMFF